ncbi:MAG: IS110 family transposase [bacterium]|nr:IS110 family transposase [bacterium]
MTNRITETIGVDLGDRYSAYCVIDEASGEELDEGRIRTTPKGFGEFFAKRQSSRVVLEVGTHSPWTSRIISASCAQTLVANPRQLGFIFKNARKSDRMDARLLARVGRLDTALLCPIRHRGLKAQQDLAVIRARAALVSARTKLVNSLRGLIKSLGARIPKQAAQSIGTKTRSRVPDELQQPVQPLLVSIEGITSEIKKYDKLIDELATTHYPETGALTQVAGVGNLTALAFVLTLEDAAHFAKSRDVGAFLGMIPKRDQSGETDKQLRISKAGDKVLRTLLVQCAHYILGRNGPPSDLKRYGERIASRGGKIAKRKAAIAVARKLAVLLHSLWRSGEAYVPERTNVAA